MCECLALCFALNIYFQRFHLLPYRVSVLGALWRVHRSLCGVASFIYQSQLKLFRLWVKLRSVSDCRLFGVSAFRAQINNDSNNNALGMECSTKVALLQFTTITLHIKCIAQCQQNCYQMKIEKRINVVLSVVFSMNKLTHPKFILGEFPTSEQFIDVVQVYLRRTSSDDAPRTIVGGVVCAAPFAIELNAKIDRIMSFI